MNIPAGIPTGRVVGRFLSAENDGADADRYPDAVPVQAMSVTFTPSEGWMRFPGTTPPVVVVNVPVACSTSSQGILTDPQGNEGVTLIAATYQVTVAPPLSPPIRFELVLAPGAELDLAHFI